MSRPLAGVDCPFKIIGMRGQSWMATVLFTLIAFGGGYLAGTHTPGPGWAAPVRAPSDPEARCFFSPSGGCLVAVVNEINAARNSIELHGCILTSEAIGKALIEAHKRGVDVRLVLDAAQTSEHRQEVQQLANAGIPVYLDARHATAHNKVILIDEQTLLLGSFDFTDAAEEANSDNLLILRNDAQLQSAYEHNFREHLAHSERFQ